MSLNNNQENDQTSFEEDFSEGLDNFDNDPAVVAATASTESKGKHGWIILLLGMLGTGAYLGYRYYLAPQGTHVANLEEMLLSDNQSSKQAAVPSVQSPSVDKVLPKQASDTPPAEKQTRQANKNAEFEALKNALFQNGPQQTTVSAKPATEKTVPKAQENAKPNTLVAVTPKEKPAASTVAPVIPAPQTTPSDSNMHQAIGNVDQLNERLQANITHIQHLEDALQGIIQTIARLNTDISAIDNRLLALSHLSNDMGTIKQEISSVKRVLGEEGMLDTRIPPPPSHTYRKASQMANARPRASQPAYVVHAIIPGRAWLKGNNGQITTVTEGDTLGDYGKVLVIDAASGMVLTSAGSTFQ
ncbi:MAG: hypothetical protein RLZ35_1077 [Pseudomonadota bacterium]|jgi:hypothetical protein